MAAWLKGTFSESELGITFAEAETSFGQAVPAVDELTLAHTTTYTLSVILGSYENAEKLKLQCSRKFRISYIFVCCILDATSSVDFVRLSSNKMSSYCTNDTGIRCFTPNSTYYFE